MHSLSSEESTGRFLCMAYIMVEYRNSSYEAAPLSASFKAIGIGRRLGLSLAGVTTSRGLPG